MKAIIAGALAGVISGMGFGGGMILIPILTVFMGLGQHEAQSVNLFYFLPTALSALAVHIKNKNADIKTALAIIPVGIAFSMLGAFLAVNIEAALLKKIFGAFLGIFGIIEVYDGFTNKK